LLRRAPGCRQKGRRRNGYWTDSGEPGIVNESAAENGGTFPFSFFPAQIESEPDIPVLALFLSFLLAAQIRYHDSALFPSIAQLETRCPRFFFPGDRYARGPRPRQLLGAAYRTQGATRNDDDCVALLKRAAFSVCEVPPRTLTTIQKPCTPKLRELLRKALLNARRPPRHGHNRAGGLDGVSRTPTGIDTTPDSTCANLLDLLSVRRGCGQSFTPGACCSLTLSAPKFSPAVVGCRSPNDSWNMAAHIALGGPRRPRRLGAQAGQPNSGGSTAPEKIVCGDRLAHNPTGAAFVVEE